jgi:hypothetical protein
MDISLIFGDYEEGHDRLCGLVARVPGYRSRGPEFDSLRYQIFREVVGLKWGPLSLVSTIKELLGRNSSGSNLETETTVVGICHAYHVAPSIHKKFALTLPTRSCHSFGIVRSRILATEFVFFCLFLREEIEHGLLRRYSDCTMNQVVKVSRFLSCHEIFLFPAMSGQALGPIQSFLLYVLMPWLLGHNLECLENSIYLSSQAVNSYCFFFSCL